MNIELYNKVSLDNSRRLTKAYSTSFSIAIRLLGAGLRNSIRSEVPAKGAIAHKASACGEIKTVVAQALPGRRNKARIDLRINIKSSVACIGAGQAGVADQHDGVNSSIAVGP